jgi:hypothetical protein
MRPARATLFLFVVLLAAVSCSELEGSGEVVTETRTVSDFTALEANNGVTVTLTIDPQAAGEVDLTVTTDSNLMEYLTTRVSGGRLTVSVDRSDRVMTTTGFEVLGAVRALDELEVNNGAEATIIGTAPSITLDINNGARLRGDDLEVGDAAVDVNNGASAVICATGTVTGEVANGADLSVRCGGDFSAVETSGGGLVSP